MVLIRYSQIVNVKAQHTVVSITALALSVPSWPMLRAMLKQLTVAGEPSITRIAARDSPRYPSHTATGKNRAGRSTSLIILAVNVGFQQPAAFSGSMLAPSAIRPKGVAVAARLDTAR